MWWLLLANIHLSARRRYRRARARARFRWHLHRSGVQCLQLEDLQRLWTTLHWHHSRDWGLLRRISVEMEKQNKQGGGWRCSPCSRQGYPGWNGKVAEFCQFCGQHWTHVHWDNSNWQRPKSPRERREKEQPDRSTSARPKEGKEKKKKEKKEKKPAPEEKDGAFTPFGKFQPGTAPSPWTTAPALSPFPAASSSTSGAASNQANNQQELVKALLACYPDAKQMPQHVKELVDKTNVESAKAVTRTMHTATTALGEAKQSHMDLIESKKLHRNNWMKHPQASVHLWQKQLEEYRTRQGELQAAIAQAAKSVELARRQIQALNSGEAATPAEEATEDVQPPVESQQDLEEEQLRASLQQTLAACEQSLGAGPTETPQKIEDSDEDLDGEGDEKDREKADARAKSRKRSAEPTRSA